MNTDQLIEKYVNDLLPQVKLQEIYEGIEEDGIVHANNCNEIFRHLYEMELQKLEGFAYETAGTEDGMPIAFALINRVYGAKKYEKHEKYEKPLYFIKATIAFIIGIALYDTFK
mgnify:CR=1 FL=1